jgi:hypothetical protein
MATLIDPGQLAYQEFYEGLGEYREDRVHNNLLYQGWAPLGASESAAEWIIRRTAISGAITYKTTAPKTGNTLSPTSQVWDDRASLFTAPPWGNAYCTSFDGVNDYINFGNNLNFERTDSFTFSCWAYFDNVTTAMTLFSKRSGSGGTPGLQINMLSNGRLEVNMVNTASTNHLRVQMTASILAQTPYHVCVTYDGSSTPSGTKLYLNGTAITLSTVTNNLSSSIATATDAFIGQFASGQYFDGRMDEITFWNDDLSSSDVLALYNGGLIEDPEDHALVANLTHYYAAGDGDTFPTWTDQVGSVDGTMTNMLSTNFTRDLPWPTT